MILAEIISNGFLKELNALEHRHHCVLWARDASYKEQLYVSQNYETIWGRSCYSLYKNMKT